MGSKNAVAVLLPADSDVMKWFNENIDNDCSASSAIYKFSSWLKSLPRVEQSAPRWVKASERLPQHPDDLGNHYRLNGKKVNGNFYQDNDGMMFFEIRGFTHEAYQIGLKSFQYLEWLDESAGESDVVELFSFAEWVKMSNWGFVRGIGWQIYGDPNPSKYLTTAELYTIFNQQKTNP